MKVLILGDRIKDLYTWCKAVKISPEAPALVVHVERETISAGGAGLVSENLESLLLGQKRNVETIFGSVSYKHRIFADRTLLVRIDKDSVQIREPEEYWKEIAPAVERADIIVVSDYGKGAIGKKIAQRLQCVSKPLFVDAKDGIEKYKGCFAIFPNEHEHLNINPADFQHVIRKLGPRGCEVDGRLVPTKEQDVFDVTGAGDVFLAAFVFKYTEWCLRLTQPSVVDLIDCAKFANKAAGISVQHMGTYVVRWEELFGGDFEKSNEEHNDSRGD